MQNDVYAVLKEVKLFDQNTIDPNLPSQQIIEETSGTRFMTFIRIRNGIRFQWKIDSWEVQTDETFIQ